MGEKGRAGESHVCHAKVPSIVPFSPATGLSGSLHTHAPFLNSVFFQLGIFIFTKGGVFYLFIFNNLQIQAVWIHSIPLLY